MDFWVNLQMHKWPSAGWILLYVICLLLIYKNKERWGIKIKTAFTFILLSVVIFLCPVFAKIMMASFLPTYLEYERMTWLMFIGPVCAYTIVMSLSELNRRKRKIVIVGVLLFTVLISNSTFLSRDYKVANSLLKIPSDVAEISQMIVDDAGCYTEDGELAVDEDGNWIKPMVLVQEEQYEGLIGNELFYGIRQYSSAPVLNSIYVSSGEYEAEGFELLNYGLMNYQYFVCSNSDSLRTQAENYGFELMYESEKYLLFKNTREVMIYFVRHGQTDANVACVFAGSGTDAMLTDEGKAQAMATGEALSDVDFSAVYTSELTRTQDTADLILNKNKMTIPESTVLWQLDDIYWGQIEGLIAAEVYAIYPDYNDDAYIGTLSDGSFVSPIGANSKMDMVWRFDGAMTQIVASTDGNALVVGHASMIWYLQSAFGDEVTVNGLENASITVLHYDKGNWTLECINESAENFEE